MNPERENAIERLTQLDLASSDEAQSSINALEDHVFQMVSNALDPTYFDSNEF